MNKKTLFLTFIILFVFVLIIGSIYLVSNSSQEQNKNSNERNDNRQISPAIKEQVESYIKENIGKLSPKEPVLGGSFYVTSVEFIDFHDCIVNYEDGHIALSARVEFQVPSADKIEITKFELIGDNSKKTTGNFSEIGNLVNKNNNLVLVYEKPGKPALTVNLLFNKQSSCFLENNQEVSCDYSWKDGDRVKVAGIKENNVIQVDTLIVE